MRAVLTIDSGGSKTEALLVGLDGSVLGWGRSLPPDADREPHPAGYGRTLEAIRAAVKQALEGHTGAELHVGLIGAGRTCPTLDDLAQVVTFELMAEHVPAFMLGGEACGVVALAGTGAFAHARDRAGHALHLDGLGPLLGDHGGGFDIGLKAIQAVARSDWHPRRATSLSDVVFAQSRKSRLFGTQDGLVHYMLKARDRSQIAAFATLVDQEARKGDRIAGEILATAAGAIAETVRDAAVRLGMLDESYAVIGAGSVMMRSDPYWDAFTRAVAGFAPLFRPVRLRHPPVAGMAMHVLSKFADVDFATARRRLIEDVDSRRQTGKDDAHGAPEIS